MNNIYIDKGYENIWNALRNNVLNNVDIKFAISGFLHFSELKFGHVLDPNNMSLAHWKVIKKLDQKPVQTVMYMINENGEDKIYFAGINDDLFKNDHYTILPFMKNRYLTNKEKLISISRRESESMFSQYCRRGNGLIILWRSTSPNIKVRANRECEINFSISRAFLRTDIEKNIILNISKSNQFNKLLWKYDDQYNGYL